MPKIPVGRAESENRRAWLGRVHGDGERYTENFRPDRQPEIVGGTQVKNIANPVFPENRVVARIPCLLAFQQSLQVVRVVVLPEQRLQQIDRKIERLDSHQYISLNSG